MKATAKPIESKFCLILVAARRARQIQSGAKPLVHTTARKPTRVAQEELKAGVLPYEVLQTEISEENEHDSVPARKGKK